MRLQVWREPSRDARVEVTQWVYTEPIHGQFLEYPRSGWVLWNYFRRVGLRAMLNKIRSRIAETARNSKITGVGAGTVVEAPLDRQDFLGRPVLFFASNHNASHRDVVVPWAFVTPIDQWRTPLNEDHRVEHLPDELARFKAWSPYSGVAIDEAVVQRCLRGLAGRVHLSIDACTSCEHSPAATLRPPLSNCPGDSRPTAVLFGLGNYAKTAILPNIRERISLQRVHEVDPEQLYFLRSRRNLELCTSPIPHDDRKFDVWFVAGFHHTHTSIAMTALAQGAVAVIEKPLATTRLQLESFLSTVSRCPTPRFFVCFHKRYSVLHQYVRADLNCPLGTPVDMHCIVYEIPLPPHHWYNWPNSGSRLISNGCHWIDYFMYINDYAELDDVRKWQPKGKDVVVQVRLKSGAYLSMSLTDTGSQRLGVRDHVEIRYGGTTIAMTDGTTYTAENRQRILRRARCNPLSAYSRMYRSIADAIWSGHPGDAVKSLRSAEATLQLEEL